jgi:hypothetical protein
MTSFMVQPYCQRSPCWTSIRDRPPLAVEEVGFNMVDEDVAAPIVLNGQLGVPSTLHIGLELVEEHTQL